MSANGEQAAAHKQQQSTTPAPPQPPPGPEHIHPPAFVQLAPHPGPYALPPGAFSPVFFGHPNPEGIVNHGDPNVPQYLPYTQMMYVYPPPIPGQAPPFPHPGAPQPAVIGKPKRKQVKMACTNCASACKKCDDGRPCQRCIRSNLASTCKDGVRKERKRGIKRGPYKRRNKPPSEDEAEVSREPAPPMPPTVPEGYFPYFLPPPGYFQGADGQNGAPPVQVPFYSYHQLAPFPYPTGIPMPFMQPLSGQPGPSNHPIEPPQPLSAKGKRQRNSTDEFSTPKKAKSDDHQASGTPDAEGDDTSPPMAEPTSQPSKPPSAER